MQFEPDIFKLFDKQWALLTAGPITHFNTMTISWGGLGTLWSLPVATVYVRKERYTHEFMDRYPYFTLSFFPESCKKDLALLGSRSGRDGDKVSLTSLKPCSIENAATFREAEYTILCEKLYAQDMLKENMPENVIQAHFLTESAHTMYIGKVLKIISGEEIRSAFC